MSENVGTLQLNEGTVPEKMNLFQRLWNLFLNPKRLFAYTAKKPSLLFPVIVLYSFTGSYAAYNGANL